MNNIDVVYTPWSNLKKTPSMDVGQVGFHNSKMVEMLSSFILSTQLEHVFLLTDPEKEVYRCMYCEEKYSNKKRKF